MYFEWSAILALCTSLWKYSISLYCFYPTILRRGMWRKWCLLTQNQTPFPSWKYLFTCPRLACGLCDVLCSCGVLYIHVPLFVYFCVYTIVRGNKELFCVSAWGKKVVCRYTFVHGMNVRKNGCHTPPMEPRRNLVSGCGCVEWIWWVDLVSGCGSIRGRLVPLGSLSSQTL